MQMGVINFWESAISIFFVFNSIGMIPAFVAILARYEHKKQVKIIVRECVIALITLLGFTFFGSKMLLYLSISQPTIGIGGGILLLLIAISMIFPKEDPTTKADVPGKEPLIIPLAIPGLAGPGSIAALTVMSHQVGPYIASASLIVAWIPSLFILLAASFIKKVLGEKGLLAVEKLGGMLISFIGIEIFTKSIIDIVNIHFIIK